MTDQQIDPNDFPREGIKKIAAFLRKSERATYYLCETGQIPAYKLGGKWCMRPSAFYRHLEKLEAETVARRERKIADKKPEHTA